jgi:hypothetical protein
MAQVEICGIKQNLNPTKQQLSDVMYMNVQAIRH